MLWRYSFQSVWLPMLHCPSRRMSSLLNTALWAILTTSRGLPADFMRIAVVRSRPAPEPAVHVLVVELNCACHMPHSRPVAGSRMARCPSDPGSAFVPAGMRNAPQRSSVHVYVQVAIEYRGSLRLAIASATA